MPVTQGLNNDQTVRQAKRQVAAAVKGAFDSDETLVRALVFGTVPGSGADEVRVLSILVDRDQYKAWNGSAEDLGEWRVAPAFQ